MEFSIRRRIKRDSAPLFVKRQIKKKSYAQASFNSTALTSMETSFISPENEFQSTIMNEQVRAKASMLLNLELASRPSLENKVKKNVSSREAKLSFMSSPKKNIVISEAAQTFRKNKSKEKISGFNTSRIGNDSNLTAKKGQSKIYEEKQQKQYQNLFGNTTSGSGLELNKKKNLSFFSLPDYFQLVFSKILSHPGKQKIYTLISQLAVRYETNPQKIAQDVIDVRSIANKLKLALGPKQTYVQLKPFEALQVNGQFARLIFHISHEIVARMYKNYELSKIYKQIEYCSRRLQFHQYTLKVCFEMGQLYKKQFDEQNSHAYYSKALKLSIFLNDRFHEQKAIDNFGVTAYSSSNTRKAYFYHENSSKLNKVQRDIIKQKYSNIEQIEINSKQKRLRGGRTANENKREKYNFNGEEYSSNYQLENKKKFKSRIKQYIQCPFMRSNILVARDHINRIEEIGKIQRYKIWQASRIGGRFKGGDDGQYSTQVMLTHRSLNRINPEYELRKIEREKKILLELIGYFINDSIDPFQ